MTIRTEPIQEVILYSQQGSELTYAELTLGRGNRRIPLNCYQPVQISSIQRPQMLPMSTLTRRQPIQEPTIYAQVASHSKPIIYVPPPLPYISRPSDEITAETPLIGHDNKVTARARKLRSATQRQQFATSTSMIHS